MEKFGLNIVLCLFFLFAVVNGSNDITTACEINPPNSDVKGNTCNCTVHVSEKEKELPLFNINGDGFVVGGTNIPPLFNRSTVTKWTRLDGSDIVHEELVSQDSVNFTNFNMNYLPPLGYHLLADSSFLGKEVKESGTVFNESVLTELYKRTHAFPFNTLRFYFERTQHVRTKLYWDNNESHFFEIDIRDGNNITVCSHNDKIECRESKFTLHVNPNDENSRAPKVFMTLYGELIISEKLSAQSFHTNLYLPEGATRYTRVDHVQDGIWSSMYHLYQGRPAHIASPWLELKTSTAVYIFYFTLPGHTVKVSLEDETSKAITPLNGVELDRVNNTSSGLERVLTKVNIPSSPGKKRIRVEGDTSVVGNIWEGTALDLNKEYGPVSCAKSNMTDIYNTLDRGGSNETVVHSCFNGGRLNNASCACPPGFAGNQCERACGRNRIGRTCSNICAMSSYECKRMILCTPDYGCTCAPGYHGDECMEECEQGTYGADCAQPCNTSCKTGCDIYTGACKL